MMQNLGILPRAVRFAGTSPEDSAGADAVLAHPGAWAS